MSLTSNIIEAALSELPSAISSQLHEIGRMDKITKHLSNQLSKEENKLLEVLKTVAKHDPTFDEEPLKRSAANISQRRQILSQMIELQVKSVQNIYLHLDKKIGYFDNILKHHAPHLHDSSNADVCYSVHVQSTLISTQLLLLQLLLNLLL